MKDGTQVGRSGQNPGANGAIFWTIATLLFGFVTYLLVLSIHAAIENATAPSDVSIWIRLPTFTFPACLILLASWTAIRIFQIRTKEIRGRTGFDMKSSIKSSFWSRSDPWIMSFILWVVLIPVAISFFAMAFDVPNRHLARHADLIRYLLLFCGVAIGGLSCISPYRLLVRNAKSGRPVSSDDLSNEKSVESSQRNPRWKKRAVTGLYFLAASLVTYFANRTTEQTIVVLFMWLVTGFSAWDAFFRAQKPKPPAE
jgi:hypothetical protein